MNRDQRLFLVATGEASPWEVLCTRLEVVWSPSAKARYRQFATIKSVLLSSLGDPDDRITLRFRHAHAADPRRLASLLLLGLLGSVLFIEWGTYTFPALAQFVKTCAHRCGIQ
jgi:hypothetical protein